MSARQVKAGDELRVRDPLAPEWAPWRGRVHKVFDDGAVIIDPIAGAGDFKGAYVLYDLTAFCFLDDTPIEPHPSLRCDQLRGGCNRNPLGACIRCGDALITREGMPAALNANLGA